MKASALAVFVLFFVSGLRGNPVPAQPIPVHLAGEAVEVRLLADVALVSGVYQFDGWFPRGDKLMYLPVFVEADESPASVLARSKFEFELGGDKFESITPCEPPIPLPMPKGGPRIQWFVVNLDQQIDAGVGTDGNGRIVRVIYEQPLLNGVFYYLPVILGTRLRKQMERDWNYQMHAAASSHVLRVLSADTDYETLADGVVVFLRHGSVVSLR